MRIFTKELTAKLGLARQEGVSRQRREGEERALKAEGTECANGRSDKMTKNVWGTERGLVWLN